MSEAFILFAFYDRAANGGAEDCRGVFPTLEAAKASPRSAESDYAHVAVIDGGELRIVAEGYTVPAKPPRVEWKDAATEPPQAPPE